jgi:hypothetical protein
MGVEATPIVVVVGVGRSGTTLLQAMLGSHSSVITNYETGFPSAAGWAAMTRRRAHRPLDLIWSEGRHRIAIHRVGLRKEVVEEVCRRLASGEILEAYAMYVEETMRGTRRGAVFVDKDPRAVEYMVPLGRALARVKFVHMIRDPRDVLASKLQAAWSRRRSLLWNLVANRYQLEKGLRAERVLGAEQVLRVHYEELIERPRETLEYVCEWLGLAYEQSMTEGFAATGSRIIADEEIQWKRQVLGSLKSANAGRWKHDLGSRQAASVEAVLAGKMRRLGYSVAQRGAYGWMVNLESKALAVLVGVLVGILGFRGG